ncbi:MAG: NAD(P)/FAD-dependent oxidoreductase [Acidobacteria bacterium]|nr:NAD(P)/FAD-dependent oxidoreductase [Acidobacteriota bacterium]
MTFRHDSAPVTIVGGSATGLFAAERLARAGRPVTVLEGANAWSPEPRTLIVTRRMRDLLGAVGDRAVVNTINHFELLTAGRRATVALSEPDLIIERAVLVPGLAEQAASAGVEFCMGSRVRGLTATGEGVTLEVGRHGSTEQRLATTVVGADGTFSRVARAAGWPPLTTVPLIQAIVKLPPDLAPDTTRVWFQPDETPFFYWLIPESDEQGALGLIGEDGPRARRCLERFLERQHLDPLAFQAARIPRYTRWVPPQRRMGGADIFLVGDAAAHVKVTTIGGIVTGFRGALGVADTILHGRTNAALRQLKCELDWHRRLRRSLERFSEADYNLLLDALTSGAKGVLSTLTRDEPARVILRVCLAQPRLILLALRTLLSRSPRPAVRS